MKNNRLKLIWGIRLVMTGLLLIFACSCTTEHPMAPKVWAETSFNSDAGLGNYLLITIVLEDGEKLRFAVDTGSPNTILDRSLQSKLGKCVGNKTARYGWLGPRKVGIFNSPGLYFDHTRLITGRHVLLDDLAPMSVPPIQGILGMDCLKHYCLQLDFEHCKMRLFSSEKMGGQAPGNAYPLWLLFGEVWIYGDFLGAGSSYFRLDSGCYSDAELKPATFRKVLAGQKAAEPIQIKPPAGKQYSEAFIDHFSSHGQNQDFMVLDSCPALGENLIGVRYLMRNLVTINFPKRIMYLQPRPKASAKR